MFLCLHDRQIGPGIVADDPTGEFFPSTSRTSNSIVILDNMMVRKQQPVRREENAGTYALPPAGAGTKIDHSGTEFLGNSDDDPGIGVKSFVVVRRTRVPEIRSQLNDY